MSDLIGTDANFELSAPPSIKNLRLLYYHNIVTKIVVVIFCNSEIQGRPGAPAVEYREAKAKCEKVGSMFKNTMKVQAKNVEECHDFNKDQIIAKMSGLKEMAQTFQSKNNEVLLVCIAFIGFSVDPTYAEHAAILKARGLENLDIGNDQYALTREGQPIRLHDYAFSIVSHPNVQCFLAVDFDGAMVYEIKE